MKKVLLTQRFVERTSSNQQVQEFCDTKVPELYLRVYPPGGKRFYIRFQHEGLRIHRKLGKATDLSLREARKQVRDEVHQTRYLEDTKELPPITLRLFSEEFFKRYPRHWKPRTTVKNKSAFWLHIAPILGDKLVHTIERRDIERWFAQLAHVKGSANQALVLMSVMMQQCEAWGYRHKNTNPCRHFKRYKAGEVERYLSPEELHRVWHVLDSLGADNPIPVMIIRLLIYTGCRSSEVRTLQWKDYRGGHWHLSDSKTGAKTVYLCSQVRTYLKKWRTESDYLFPARCHTKPISEAALSSFWHKVRSLAELEGVRLHDLRHTYASIAIQSNINLTVLSRLLGHAEVETTLKYAHLSNLDVCKAASRISGALVKGMRS
ncbi:tyrosine-type recombinase/integrase [Vibrio mimicus]